MNNFLNNIKYINFKSKKTILVLISIVLLLIIIITLYNIRFKYDSQDPFFKAINVRATQLEDKYVYKKLYIIQKAFTVASNNIPKQPISTKYVTENIVNNPFPYPAFRNKGNKVIVGIIRLLGFVKISDRSIFANKYIDLNNKFFKIPYESNYTYVQLPYNAVIALNITNPSCLTNSANNYCGDAYIDINGKRPPNQLGVDLFDVGIYHFDQNTNLLLYVPFRTAYTYSNCVNLGGHECFFYAKYFNRDYLKTKESRINHSVTSKFVYLASNGKLVYFDKYGFDSFVTLKTFSEQIPIALDNAYWNNPIRNFNEFVKMYKQVRIIQKQIEQEEAKKPKSFIYPSADTKPVAVPPQNKNMTNTIE